MIKSVIQNKFLEINFILFPIWILPVYFLMKFFILPPELTFLIFLILLGETHFASTLSLERKESIYRSNCSRARLKGSWR